MRDVHCVHCVHVYHVCKVLVLVLKFSNEASIFFIAEPQLSHEARAPSLPSISTLNGKNYNSTRLTHR